MGWWARYLATFEDNLRHGAGDGVQSALTGKSVSEVARQRRGERHTAASVEAFLRQERPKYEAKVAKERARGNKNYPEVILEGAMFDGVPAVARFNENGQRGKVEIFYGGGGNSPLEAPSDDYHGHIVIVNDAIVSWLEPGPEAQRNRLY